MAGVVMTLNFRHLRLRVETGRGRFGADIPFTSGLMVFRADNSRGKSTSVQSLLFALGLERMITTRPAQAVTSAMRDRLIYDFQSKSETPVLSSWVSVEIENHRGEIAVVTRWVKHESINSGLVRVVNGPAISTPGDQYTYRDFYTGRPGAVANPQGFHRWLANFMGWAMPDLPSSDGRVSQLYIEQVFPLLFVEQRRGWAGIQAQMPYFSGVSEVRRRAIEFLLDLEVGKFEAERLRLKALESKLQVEWKDAVKSFIDALRGQGLVAVGIPEMLTVEWPPEQGRPTAVENRGSGWVSIDTIIQEISSELYELENGAVPTAGEDNAAAEERLAALFREADDLRSLDALLREEIIRDRAELRSIADRLDALRADYREHQDVVRLQQLGSSGLGQLHGDCPVCHQSLPVSLLGAEAITNTLSPEDTLSYIDQQIDLFEVMSADTARTLTAKTERWSALRGRSAELRSDIRAIRQTLVSPSQTPSIEFVTRKVRLSERLERLKSMRERLYELLSVLGRLAEAGRSVKAALKELPKDGLSATDRAKLKALQQSFIQQLQEYDFGSFSDENLRISEQDYLPRREEFDLQADISASDSIRVVWAYLLGLVDVSARYATNHPGLLVFDEPRQQSAKAVSFRALLHRASVLARGRQIIFATSEELGSLQKMLVGVPHHLHAIDGYVLKPISG